MNTTGKAIGEIDQRRAVLSPRVRQVGRGVHECERNVAQPRPAVVGDAHCEGEEEKWDARHARGVCRAAGFREERCRQGPGPGYGRRSVSAWLDRGHVVNVISFRPGVRESSVTWALRRSLWWGGRVWKSTRPHGRGGERGTLL